ncbi:MAG: spore cortex biosynthesis protein YabQ [Clostridiales bacterium]|nr:spore cortex biosynthesis protein YabQ [Clostridiales bacterium]
MTVSETIGGEAYLLGASVLLGSGLFFLYDILRIFRRIIPHGAIWIGVEDLLYWLFYTGAVFVLLYRENDGMARGFVLGGAAIGMLLYYGLLSRFVIKVNVLVIRTVTGLVGKILHTLFYPIFFVLKKMRGFFRKRLKKLARAVKIGLYKR